ncbi:isochorismatase family cysteine hydrolase [Metamycoplasma neophronis]|uniref:Cysteine hydrolase n=1 Tax=Metamycoplasma neophronis TaxID=872983 RepID=A0ABY2Z2F5_9BACT|nr:isochorismatase family cysteine hydrolase [Metamycoplasma neophronis]TPR54301.1 cysteine hydrolase [Metamycoplasma neophronis]
MKKITIVIDMLSGFAKKGALSSPLINAIIKPMAAFLETRINVDNIFICDAHSANDIEMQSYPIHCLKGSEEAEVVSELQKYVKQIVHKNSTNGFFEVSKQIWKEYDEFEIIGCCTDICVMQFATTLKTYLNMLGENKNVIIYKDLVATFDSPSHKADEYQKMALSLMENAGIIIK